MKKRLICLMTAFMLMVTAFSVGTLEVHAAKQETLSTSVKQFMKYAKAFHIKGIRSRVADLGEYDMIYDTANASSADEMYKYYKKCAKKMKWKVVSKKKRNKTTVDVKFKIRYVNSKQFTENLMTNISNDMLSGKMDLEKMLEMTEKQLMKYMNSVVRRSAASVKKTAYRTQTIKVTFVKKGTKWKVKKMTKALDNVLQANVPVSMEKLANSLY